MDQVDRLILEVQGKEKLEALNGELAREEAELLKLAAALRAGSITQQQFAADAQRAAADVVRIKGEIKALQSDLGRFAPGVLQASYAIQDFTSVLSGGQGLSRALMSVQNNIPGLLMALGAGQGLAGVFSLLSMGVGAFIPIVEKMWGALDNKEAAEAAKQKLREIKQQIDEAHKAFLGLRDAPTDYESESAGLMREFLGDRPNAEKLREGLMASMGRKSGEAGLAPKQREEYDALAKDVLSEEGIRRLGEAAAADAEGAGLLPGPAREQAMARARAASQRARDRRDELLEGGRRQAAERLMRGMLKAGPEGDAARGDAFRRMGQMPEAFPPNFAAHMQELQPGALRHQDEEFEREQEANKEWHDRREAQREEHRKERAEIEAEADFQQGRLDDSIREMQQARARNQREGREAAADIKRRAAEVQHERREAPQRMARDAVIRETRAEGLTPNAHEVDEMAAMTLRNLQDGMNMQGAVMMAIWQKMEAINRAVAHYQQMQQAMWAQAQQQGMGQEWTGMFTTLPPIQ